MEEGACAIIFYMKPHLPKVIILHGWTNGDISGIPEYLPDSPGNWMGWTKRELESRGYDVITPFIRFGYKSDYNDWKKHIDSLDIDANTILVGWSSGGAFWVRWLGETRTRIRKLILVAPAKAVGNPIHFKPTLSEGQAEWESFHDFTTDPTIKELAKEIVVFISNDADWLVTSAELYAKELDAQLIRIKNQGHFQNELRSGPEFPEMLEVIIR